MSEPYKAKVIVLNDKPKIKVTHHGYIVGYFDRVEDINDHGLPVDLATLEILT